MRLEVGRMFYREVEAVANDFLSINFFFKRYGADEDAPVVLTAEEV